MPQTTQLKPMPSYKNLCIVCLKTGEISLLNSTFSSFFMNLTGVKVNNKYDRFPKRMCYMCFLDLNKVATFIKKCKNSHDLVSKQILVDKCKEEKEKRKLKSCEAYLRSSSFAVEEEPIKCLFCHSNFSSAATLENHRKICGTSTNKTKTQANNNDYNFIIKSRFPKNNSDPADDNVQNNVAEITLQKNIVLSNDKERINIKIKFANGEYKVVNDDQVENTQTRENETTKNKPKNKKKSNADAHTMAVISNAKKCQKCGASIISKIRHYKFSPECGSRCAVCGKEMRSQLEIKEHRIKHSKEESRFKCNICKKIFDFEASLKRHLVVHEDDSHLRVLRSRVVPPRPCQMATTGHSGSNSLHLD